MKSHPDYQPNNVFHLFGYLGTLRNLFHKSVQSATSEKSSISNVFAGASISKEPKVKAL